jgi:hypothetical protein
MIKRPCKEIKIKTNPNFDIKYGTFNKNNPKSIYIFGKSWVKPIHPDFLESVEKITKEVKLFKIKNKTFSENKIINIDITKNRMSLNKNTLLSFEIHLLQNETKQLDDEILIDNINDVIEEFTNNIKENSKGYIQFKKNK